jgi:hypothetical protein
MNNSLGTEILLTKPSDFQDLYLIMNKHQIRLIRGYSHGSGSVVAVEADSIQISSILKETKIIWSFV